MLGFGDPREDHSFGEQWLAFAGFHYHAVDEDSAWDNVVEVVNRPGIGDCSFP